MTRVPVHTVDSAPDGSRKALAALEATFGVLGIPGARSERQQDRAGSRKMAHDR